MLRRRRTSAFLTIVSIAFRMLESSSVVREQYRDNDWLEFASVRNH
jgi:hypothetical protein